MSSDLLYAECWPEGHDGPHYDRADDMSWRTIVTEGKPGKPIGQETPR